VPRSPRSGRCCAQQRRINCSERVARSAVRGQAIGRATPRRWRRPRILSGPRRQTVARTLA
jgi:hypothetical protein